MSFFGIPKIPTGPLRRALGIESTGKKFVDKIVSMAPLNIRDELERYLNMRWKSRKFEIGGGDFVELIDEQPVLMGLIQQELQRIPQDLRQAIAAMMNVVDNILGISEGPIQNFLYLYIYSNYVIKKLQGEFNEEEQKIIKNKILENYQSFNGQSDLISRFKQELNTGIIKRPIENIKNRISRITGSQEIRTRQLNNILDNFSMILLNGSDTELDAELPNPKPYQETISKNLELAQLIQTALDSYDFLTPELKNAFAEDIVSSWPTRNKVRGRLRTPQELIKIITQPCFRNTIEGAKKELVARTEMYNIFIQQGNNKNEAKNTFRSGTTRSWAREVVDGLDSEYRETIINNEGIMTGSTTYRGLLKWGRSPCNAKLLQSSYDRLNEHEQQLTDEVNKKYGLPSLKKTSRVLQQPPNFGIQTLPTFPLPPVPAVSQTGFARRKTKRKIHKNKNKKKTRSRKFHR
jgi:hypothetical protein